MPFEKVKTYAMLEGWTDASNKTSVPASESIRYFERDQAPRRVMVACRCILSDGVILADVRFK